MQSPQVTFGFENQNVQQSTPLSGVSHVLARTLNGAFNDPSVVVSSISQFKELFGGEIVPDGSVSNIEIALQLGSKVRVCRVPGAGIEKATSVDALIDPIVGSLTNDGMILTDGTGGGFTMNFTFNDSKLTAPVLKYSMDIGISIRTKYYTPFFSRVVKFFVNSSNYLCANLYKDAALHSDLVPNNLLESIPLFLVKTKLVSARYQILSIDFASFSNFLNNQSSKYLEFVLESAKIDTDTAGVITSVPITGGVNGLLTSINTNKSRFLLGGFNAGFTGDVDTETFLDEGTFFLFDGGSAGAAPDAAAWINSLDYLKDYNESYQLACSHLNQHLAASDVETVNVAMAAFVNQAQEEVYYIDVPKHNTSSEPMSNTEIAAWIDDMVELVGNSKYVAYFAGGYKYYDVAGNLKDCDNLGTILGLGASSEASFGPWYHFSGLNRGLVLNAKGIVSPNYGSPSNYAKLNVLAGSFANMAVIKDTRSQGKQVTLWHNFTSQLLDNSEKYLGIVRLNLYLKKNLRPILESQIEEPNTFSTWSRIYFLVKPILENLIGKAITQYTWLGDQDAKSYAELQINNEADVRMGKYKAKLVYKEIVALQEIAIDIVIDAVTGSVSVSVSPN